MNPPESAAEKAPDIRPLQPGDLDAVVALDARITGRARPAYFKRRLEAALRHPKHHLQLAAVSDGTLAGFVLARVSGGEYGGVQDAVLLESVGVAPALARHGAGRLMHQRLVELARHKGARALQTQVSWKDTTMVGFLAAQGYQLDGQWVLERQVARRPAVDDAGHLDENTGRVRRLNADDVDRVLHIDTERSGVDRQAFLRRKVEEALEDSAVEMSLVVEDDNTVVGFCLAHVDHGAFGRAEPRASLEAISVQEGFAHKGYARALVGQLRVNLAGLLVETLEVSVDTQSLGLLGFLVHMGFSPAQRLSLALAL